MNKNRNKNKRSKSAIAYKIRMVEEFCDRAERGVYNPLKLQSVTDAIDWLYRWRFIDSDQMTALANRVIAIMDMGLA